MNKIARAGVDLQVAARRLGRGDASHVPGGAPFNSGAQAPQPTWRRRMLAPLRPLANRLRDFLIFPLVQRLDLVRAQLETVGESPYERSRIVSLETQLGDLRQQMQAREAQVSAQFDSLQSSLAHLASHAAPSAQRIAVACGPDELLVRTDLGPVLCPTRDPELLSTLLEPSDAGGSIQLVQRLLRPGDVFVDVGAGVGMHSLAAAGAMGGQGRVEAYEPFEGTARLLARTVWMNGCGELVRVHPAAVGRHDGKQPLHLATTSLRHSLYPSAESAIADAPVHVRVVRLDSALTADAPVRLVRVDVAGAELDVLEGAKATIEAHPDIVLLVRFSAKQLASSGVSVQDWLAAFTALGLDWRVVDAGTGALREANPTALEHCSGADLFFARPQSPAWRAAAQMP